MKKLFTNNKTFTNLIFSILLLLLGFNVSWGQQTIGSFPTMDGGFEAQTTIATASSIPTNTVSTGWATACTSGVLNTTGGRSGAKYATLTLTNAAAGSSNHKRTTSPTTALGAITNTSYQVQYYYRTSGSSVLTGSVRGGASDDGTPGAAYATAVIASQSTWTKYTGTVAVTQATITYGLGIISIYPNAASNTLIYDVDDFVVYPGTTLDSTAPSSPGSVTVAAASSTSNTISWGAASGGVDGGGYVVVRYTTNPGAGTDPNTNGIYAVGNTITNGGATGTVAYIGTGLTFTDSSLTGGSYYYKVYTVDKAFNYSTAASAAATYSVSAASSSPTLCINNPLTPINHSTTGFTGIGTAMGLPSGVTATWANNTITISGTPTTSGTYIYSIPLTGGDGTINATGTIVVNANISVSVNIIASTSNICSGSSVTFIATPINGGSTPIYQWQVNGVNVGINSATYLTANLTNNDLVSVVMISNASPCLTNSAATSNSIVIIVNPKTTPTFTRVAAVCSGASIAALPTTSANAVTGTWSPAINNTATTTYTFTPNAGQCVTSETQTIDVISNSAPTGTSQTLCANSTVSNLVATGANLQWYTSQTGGALLDSNTTLSTGTYFVSQTISACESTRTPVAITVLPQITPTFTPIASTCTGATITPLPNNSNNGIIGIWSPALNNNQTTTYTFTPNFGQCASATNQTITITKPEETSEISFVAQPIAVTGNIPCLAPSTQPTALVFNNATSTSVSGSFTTTIADNYLVISSTTATLNASPTSGIVYTVGSSIGNGTVLAVGSTPTFSVTGLTAGGTYYFTIYALNDIACSNGPIYNTTSPLTSTITLPAVALNYYFGNFHSHSEYSDGTGLPTGDFAYGDAANCMDFLGISEHNHVSAGMALANWSLGRAQALASTTPTFLALYGMEWGVISGGGHVIVYGVPDLLGWDTGQYNTFVAKNDYIGATGLFHTINAFGGNAFATLAHPNNSDYQAIMSTYNTDADLAIVGTAVENGPSTSTNTTYTDPPSSMSYLSYYRNMLAKGYHLGPTIDHDNHNVTHGHTALSRTVVLATSLTENNILDAMRQMHFYASQDCSGYVTFKLNGNQLGSSVTGAGAPNITVTSSTSNPVTSLKIYSGEPGSGTNATILSSSTSGTINYSNTSLTNGSTRYYYIDITESDGKRIITTPIWYTRNDTP